jgi:hypothetical protein
MAVKCAAPVPTTNAKGTKVVHLTVNGVTTAGPTPHTTGQLFPPKAP